jgi:hypothetical protein
MSNAGAKRKPGKKDHKRAPKSSLFEALADAHEADHAILEALGIKHPHVPLLSVLEMLEHLKGNHTERPRT